jgi:hypothetical protein
VSELSRYTIILIILIISSFSLAGFFAYERFRIEAFYKENVADIESLRKENIRLEDQLSLLQNQVYDLQLQLNLKEANVSRIDEEYQSLQIEYEALKRDYQLTSELKIGNSLTSFYDYVRQEKGFSGDASYKATDEDRVQFAVNLVLHDLNRYSWPSIEDEYYEKIGIHSYDAAWNLMQIALNNTGIEEDDSMVDGIEKILTFVNGYLEYEIEFDNIFRAPVETLSMKHGDCEDYAILASAFFETVGIDSAIGFFQNIEDEYHAMVLIHIEDLGEHGFWYFDDLTHLGLREGRWIIIEPQYEIEHQEYDEWMSQWSLRVAAEVES